MEVKINDYLLDNSGIIGVVGNNEYFINIFKSFEFSKNSIYLDKKKLTISDKKQLLNKISIIEDNILDNYKDFTIYDYIKFTIIENISHLADYRKKIKDSLRIVGLPESYLEKKISKLSSFEFKLVVLARELVFNPNIIIVKNFFNSLDLKNTKKMLGLFNQLIERYKKIVILCSNDSEFIYKYTKKLIVVNNSGIILQGNTSDIYEEKTDILISNGISIPNTILFTQLVLSKKGVRLSYHKDIRDLIKDIYKKV